MQAGPPLRATLYQLSDAEHLVALTLHKIICDAFSSGILQKEIAAAYDCIVNGTPLRAPRPQYGDYIRAQEEYFRSSQFESDLEYWRDKLAGVSSGPELPTDRTRPLVQSFRGAEHVSVLSGELLVALRRFAEAEQSTAFLALLSTFFCVLARYTAAEDIVLGTEVTERHASQWASVLGAVSNQLVLRADCSGDPSFREMLQRISLVWSEAHRHQAMPFGTMLDAFRVPRDLSRNPLFQVAFNRRAAAESFVAADLRWEPVTIATESASLDLSVDVTERDHDIQLRFCYSTDLFDHATIARLIGHFRTLLHEAIADPEQVISQFPLLTAAEKNQVLVEWNDTRRDLPHDWLLHQFVENQAEQTPNAVALICGDAVIPYRDLNARANQLANYLLKRGAGPELLVGIHSQRTADMLVAILGILKSGSAYVPLDPNYPRERIRHILDDAKAPLVVTHSSIADGLPELEGQRICIDSDWAVITRESTANPSIRARRDNLAYVLFTSGSTGRPKGVAIEHHSAATFVKWALEVFTPQELAGVLFSTSMCFDLSIFEMFVPLSSGGAVILAENALYLPNLPAKDRVTLINTVPSAMSELLHLGGVPDSVKTINLAGEALPAVVVEQIYATTRTERVYNLYGPTEDTTYSTYTLVRRGMPVTVGRPIANSQAYILDANLNPVPIGVPGEMYLAGEGLARGYYGRPDLTCERFIPNPFNCDANARMYRTGDLTRLLPDGNIEYLGRIDHQVKIRGFRIELGEIENALDGIPAVRQSVVLAREDVPGDKRLVAYLVSDRADLSIREVRECLAKTLPEYMVPTGFSLLPKLPLTPSGKVDRKALPVFAPPHQDRSSVIGARNQVEAQLVSIFQKILNLDSVSVLDDFFALGGHSLMAARLVSMIHETTGRKIPLGALFRAATVESLALLIQQEPEIGGDPVVLPIQRGENGRLPFFAIVPPGEESLGYAILARHMGPEQTVYKIQGHAPVTRGKRPYSRQEMRALTDEYIAAMRSVQPSGPYCLGGECDGTHIAEQIVLSLEAQGEEVGLFAIFDTWVLQHSQRRWLWKIYYYGRRLQELKEQNFKELLLACKEIAEGKLQILVGRKPRRTEWSETYWPEGFSPPHFRAPVILFKRPKQPFYYVKDPQMGWGGRTLSTVEIHEFDFNHLEMLREPHVRIFGQQLSECISRVSRRHAGSHSVPSDSEPSLLTTSSQPAHPSP